MQIEKEHILEQIEARFMHRAQFYPWSVQNAFETIGELRRKATQNVEWENVGYLKALFDLYMYTKQSSEYESDD